MKLRLFFLALGALSCLFWSLPAYAEDLESAIRAIEGASYERELEIFTGIKPLEIGGRTVVLGDRFSPESMKVTRDYLRQRFAGMGFADIHYQRFGLTDYHEPYVRNDPQSRGKGVNYWVEIPGSEHPEEIVTFGAHYDTTGVQRPGADDNASGLAAVLTIAEAFKKTGVRPQRTIRFVLFDGEEIPPYFQGSEHFFQKSKAAQEKNVLFLNLDMIGYAPKNEPIGSYSGKYLPKAEALVRRALGAAGNELKAKPYEPYLSDHLPAIFHGIPAVAFFEFDAYPYYHQRRDTKARVNVDYALRMSRWAAAALYLASHSDERFEHEEPQRVELLKNVAEGLRDDEEPAIASWIENELIPKGCSIAAARLGATAPKKKK